MKLYSIPTGNFKLDGGAMFGVVPKSIWNKLNPADENNLCSWAMRCLLVEEGNRLVLIDTGIGNKQDEKFLGHYHLHGEDSLEKSLAKHGFHRDDITDVVLTHLHFDHCGGSIVREEGKLVPAFKNATYWSHEAHWQWAIQPNAREKASFLKDNILPIQESGQLKFITDAERMHKEGCLPEIPFMEDFSFRMVSGHTESMMLPQLNYKGYTLVFMADLLPSTAHIPLPYVMAYDTRPLLTLSEKEQFLREAQEKDYVLFYEHDVRNECGRLVGTEKGIRAGESFGLGDWG